MSHKEDYRKDINRLFSAYIAPLLQIDSGDYKVINDFEPLPYKGLCLNASINRNNYKISTKFENSPLDKIVNSIWNQLFSIYIFIVNQPKSSNYTDALYDSAFVFGIAQWLGGGQADQVIYKILQQFMSWSMKTYEGNRVRFGVVVDTDELLSSPNKTSSYIDFVDLLYHDSAASVSDGSDTYFVVSKDGKILDVSDKSNEMGKVPYSPFELKKVCQSCLKNNVGICLSASGDIYCFKKQQLKIARLNGKWVGFSYEVFANYLKSDKGEIEEEIIEEIYNTCLDVSFARTGGCLAICDKLNSKNEDLLDLIPKLEDTKKKFPLIQDVYNHKFFKLPRLIRKEYMGIDGATVIDFKGNVISIGAIIKSVNPEIDGGGRKAATKKLSEFGIATKISSEGYIQIMRDGNILKEFR